MDHPVGDGPDRAVSGTVGVAVMFVLTIAIVLIIGTFVLLPA